MQACLTKDPRERPSAEQLLQHEWLVKQLQAEAVGLPEVHVSAPKQQSGLLLGTEAPSVMPKGVNYHFAFNSTLFLCQTLTTIAAAMHNTGLCLNTKAAVKRYGNSLPLGCHEGSLYPQQQP